MGKVLGTPSVLMLLLYDLRIFNSKHKIKHAVLSRCDHKKTKITMCMGEEGICNFDLSSRVGARLRLRGSGCTASKST